MADGRGVPSLRPPGVCVVSQADLEAGGSQEEVKMGSTVIGLTAQLGGGVAHLV